jgi:hypothetical protein
MAKLNLNPTGRNLPAFWQFVLTMTIAVCDAVGRKIIKLWLWLLTPLR